MEVSEAETAVPAGVRKFPVGDLGVAVPVLVPTAV